MKTVAFEDERGYKYLSTLRDNDPEDEPEKGIIQGPPSLDGIDWSGVKRDIHNRLFELGAFTWNDAQRTQAVVAAIQSAVKWRVIAVYKEQQ